MAVNDGLKATQWFNERLPALASGPAPELVLLHGWGATAEVWRAWLPLLRQRCHVTLLDLPGFGRSAFQPDLAVDDLLDQLRAQTPAGAVWVGWSLGGTLATAMTQRHPEHCGGLLTLATNPCFVARPDWSCGMAQATFDAFVAEAVRNPAALHRRFLGLQAHGGDDERALLRWLRQTAAAAPTPAAAAWGLQLLAELDVRQALTRWHGPGLHILGGNDALVPASVAAALGELVPEQWVMSLAGTSHVPFLSEPELVYHNLIRIVGQTGQLPRWRPPRRDKRQVARAFSRAAASYDSVADLQRQVADGLRMRLRAAVFPRRGETWLDLGCGTGAETIALWPERETEPLWPERETESLWPERKTKPLWSERKTKPLWPEHETQTLPKPDDEARQPGLVAGEPGQPSQDVGEPLLIGLDLAVGMVAHARQRWPRLPIRWICGDAESLPLAAASLDGVFSSLAAQWAEHVDGLFAELFRVLKPGASAWIATLGPATLSELASAWRAVDDRVHVNDFPARATLEAAIARAGLVCAGWDEEAVVQRYRDLGQLTRELRQLGATNSNSGRPAGLGGRQRVQRLLAAYEPHRDAEGLLPASWQVWYLHLRRPSSAEPAATHMTAQATTQPAGEVPRG